MISVLPYPSKRDNWTSGTGVEIIIIIIIIKFI